jgi:HK97 family phage major capsid protein
MHFEEQITKQVNKISEGWDNFKEEYAHMKDQLSRLHTAFNRPILGVGDSSCSQEKSACVDYLRKGAVASSLKDHFSSSSDSGAGLIMPTLSRQIVSNIHAISPIRQLASIETISSNELDIIVEENQFETGWVAETDKRLETKTPKLKQKKIMLHELYAQPMATQRLIDDSEIDIYTWISARLSDYFARAENNAFINGDGLNKPKGILSDETLEVIDVHEEEKIAVGDILKLINSLNEYYQQNASFVMHRSTLSYIQTLKDDTGRFIWQPSYSDLRPQTLFGIPVHCCDDMPIIEKGKLVIALGDFKNGYKIVDRQGICIIHDPYTNKPFVKFYSVKRVGGDVVNNSAIKLLKF